MGSNKHTELPRGWVEKTLSQVTNLCTNGFVGKATDQYDDTNEGALYIQGYNVIEGGFNLNGIKRVNRTFHLKNSKSILKEGDLLTIQTGDVGLTTMVTKELEGANCHALIISRFKKDLAHSAFFLQYFNSEQGRRKLKVIETGSTMKHLNVGDMVKLKIPLPPLPEQRAIANILSTWDTAIHTTQDLISQKEAEKKWLMQNLLTGKKRLKGFSGEWKEYPFEKLLKVVKRPVKWDDNELYKLISVRRRSGGIFFREALYGHQIKVKDLRDAEVGDFLFSKMQIVHGASALVTKEFKGAKISGSYIATVANDPKLLNMEFFNWYSKLPYFYHQALISSYGVHIEKMTFDFDTFLKLEMKLPSFEEQTAIAEVLQTADKEIELLKTKLEQQKLQKKGLMQVLLTGKIRVKI